MATEQQTEAISSGQALHDAVEKLAGAESLDAVVEPLDAATAPLHGGKPHRILSGAWLGHRVHPLLTDIVVDSYTSAALLDVVGGRAGRDSARTLVAVGLLATPPTVLTGFSDWGDQPQRPKRVGVVHALMNAAATGLYVASWRRRRQKTASGALLSFAGLGIAGTSAYLGGHMTYAQGAGVDRY